MKKLMVLAAMLGLALAAAIPAKAQEITNAFDDLFDSVESQSGSFEAGYEVANEGDYAGQCTPDTQFGNTVTPRDEPRVVQYASELDDLEVGGSVGLLQIDSKMDDVNGNGLPITLEPAQATSCERSTEQAGTAG